MKIFAIIDFNREYYWIYAKNKDEAEKVVFSEFGIIDNDILLISEILKEEWDECYLLDTNEIDPEIEEDDKDYDNYNPDDYDCGYKIECSFAEYVLSLKDDTPSHIICKSNPDS